LSEGLSYELSGYGVDVCCWRPAGVSTKMIGNKKPDAMTTTAQLFVEAALGKCNAATHYGVW